MQKHQLYINLFAITSALALGACADEVENAVTPDVPEIGEKTPIELSVGGVDAQESAATRAVITNRTADKTFSNLTNGTSIFMLMKSDYVALTGDYVSLNFGGASAPDGLKAAKYATTCGTVEEDNKVSFNDDASTIRTRYWDDAHARSSKLNIWAVACDGLQKLGGIGTDLDEASTIFNTSNCKSNFSTTTIAATSLEWNVPNGTGSTQNADIIKNRDLLFSNNLANYSTGDSDADKDKRLKFDPTSSPKFSGGELVFYHALSKITIKLQKGEGFTGTNDFKFPAGKNVQLNHFNIWGKFSVEQGEFTDVNKPYNGDGHASIMSIYNKTGNTPSTTAGTPAYELEALVLPSSSTDTKIVKGSRLISGNTDVMMEFTIDNNTYKITSDALFKAMHVESDPSKALVSNATKVEDTNDGAYIPLEAGKNYVFTFTIGKTKIQNITAQIVGWEDVVALPQTPSNARITLKVEERGTAQTSGLALYRAKDAKSPTGPTDTFIGYDWNAGYSDMSATYSSDNSRWETSLFWDNNADYYHFRALSPAGQTINKPTGLPENISLTSSSCADADHYNQIAWGAPFMDDDYDDDPETFKFTYDRTNGFNVNRTSGSESVKQIYHAIGATEDPVKLIMFHMMSGVHFTIKTTGSADSNTDKVELYRAAVGETPAKRTKVELIGYYSTGMVLLGTGYVDVTGSKTSATEISFASATDEGAYTNQEYFYSAVPQSLENVELVITTPDNNQYKVALKNVKATSVTSNNVSVSYTDSKLDYWYPGFIYNYSMTLKKTGIDDLQATIVNWETVTADNETVTIK